MLGWVSDVQAHRIGMIENALQGRQAAVHRRPRDLAVGILALLASTPNLELFYALTVDLINQLTTKELFESVNVDPMQHNRSSC
jgi:hypothetical protein